jgi:hypothetical protein
VDRDLDTVVWNNGADMSPDFLYDIGVAERKVVEARAPYEPDTKR